MYIYLSDVDVILSRFLNEFVVWTIIVALPGYLTDVVFSESCINICYLLQSLKDVNEHIPIIAVLRENIVLYHS